MPKAVKNRVSSNDRTFIKKCREADQCQDYFRNRCRYVYAFFKFTMILVNIVTTLFPGILFQLFVPCILLSFLLIPLHINTDLDHAGSPVKCYVNSTIMTVVLLAVIKWILMSSNFWYNKLVFAPVENINHRIYKIDKTIYQKRNLIICVRSSENAENVLKKYIA